MEVKYLGVYINSLTNCFDPSVAIRKFFASFNDIMSIIGHSTDETVAVHLVKIYCLPILLYGCEAWSLSSSDMHKLNVAWNNCYRRIFNACWRESVKQLFYCNTMPLSFIADQRKIVFRKRIMCTNNAVLSTLARVHINHTVAMSSLYHIHFPAGQRSLH